MIYDWLRQSWQRLAARNGETTDAPLPEPDGTPSFLRGVGPVKARPPAQFFTPEAMRRAWLAMKRAGGGAGVDGMTLARFEENLDQELETLRSELIAGTYRPRPVRRILAPKADGGLRPLALWALRDRIAQRVVYEILAPSFETIFLPCSFGFRPGRGVEDAVQQVLTHRDRNRRWVVDGDIEHCFDNMDTRRLLRLVKKRVKDQLLVSYVACWLHADIFNSADGLPEKAGASQGSALSPLLANIYLHEFDRMLLRRRLALVRYADDFVICCRRKADAEEALVQAEQALGRIGLSLNRRKSQVVHFDQGFAWLGYFFVRRECYRV